MTTLYALLAAAVILAGFLAWWMRGARRAGRDRAIARQKEADLKEYADAQKRADKAARDPAGDVDDELRRMGQLRD